MCSNCFKGRFCSGVCCIIPEKAFHYFDQAEIFPRNFTAMWLPRAVLGVHTRENDLPLIW
uniref:Uncharacterized protein n=1 Tax=Anguilla anguilla TaxID=7936 RepID=A0A0E9RAK4_ANGAN